MGEKKKNLGFLFNFASKCTFLGQNRLKTDIKLWFTMIMIAHSVTYTLGLWLVYSHKFSSFSNEIVVMPCNNISCWLILVQQQQL